MARRRRCCTRGRLVVNASWSRPRKAASDGVGLWLEVGTLSSGHRTKEAQ
jgi:hypothetical protein